MTARRSMRAAGDVELGEFFVDFVIPELRTFAARTGVRHGDFAQVEFSATRLFRDQLDLGGSHVRAIQVCQQLKVLVMLRHGISGNVGRKIGGNRPTLWSVNMVRNYERREVRDAWDAVATDQSDEVTRRRRRRQRTEDRLTRGMSDETTGTEVEQHHEHEAVLDHEHLHRTGPHTHEGRDEPPTWVHADEQTHEHYNRSGPHSHEHAGMINWVEVRHHTHHRSATCGERSPDGRVCTVTVHDTDVPHDWQVDDVERRDGARPLGVRREVRTDLEGEKHPAVLERPETDQRYRDLLDIISDLEAKVLRYERRVEQLESERRDPSVAEADEVRSRYGKV